MSACGGLDAIFIAAAKIFVGICSRQHSQVSKKAMEDEVRAGGSR